MICFFPALHIVFCEYREKGVVQVPYVSQSSVVVLHAKTHAYTQHLAYAHTASFQTLRDPAKHRPQKHEIRDPKQRSHGDRPDMIPHHILKRHKDRGLHGYYIQD